MDHLAPSSGVNWYTNYNPFGELLAATSQLPPMELEGVDVGRSYNTQTFVHYPTQGGGLDYEQDTLTDPSVVEEYLCQENDPTSTQTKVFRQVKVPVGQKIACQECGATFACTANLRNHMRIHTGERPFVCEECGASFTQRSNMRSHKRVHTGERPYMCGICGQTFARSSHLPGHMRTHTGEKPFNCSHCGRSFATNQIMKNHMRTHTGERPFVCNVCDATFAQSSCLATHKKIHTGERNFKCGKCGKAFISRSGLQTHERVHTGEKPYHCERCYKSFRTSSYLSKHRQKYCGSEAFSMLNKQSTSIKSTRKPCIPLKLSKGKKTVSQAGRLPSKKSQVKRRQNFKLSKRSSLTPEELSETNKGNNDVKMNGNNPSKDVCGNGRSKDVTSIMSAVETSKSTLLKPPVQKKTLCLSERSEESISGDNRSLLLKTKNLTKPFEHMSPATEVSHIKVENQGFIQGNVHLDVKRNPNPHDRLIGAENDMEVSYLKEEDRLAAEPLKQEYEAAKTCNKSQCAILDSHPQGEIKVIKTQHHLLENCSIEARNPVFSECAYKEETQSPPLVNVHQLCEELPQLTTESSDVLQQACVVKGNPVLLYARSFI